MGSFSVVTNVSSVNAQKELEVSNLGLQKALQRLSSGLRINRSGDDAAGLAVANDFRSRVAVLQVGVRNANDGLSRLQTSDSALNNIAHLLDRAAALAAQSASGGFEGSRATLDAEFQQVMAEINREAAVAKVGASNSFSVFVGGGTSNITASFTQDVTTTALGLTATIGQVDTAAEAATAVAAISTAIANLGTAQGQVGQAQNRLQFAISLAQSQIVNTLASESRIRDANIAEESASLTRYNILTQSGLAALANANSSTAAVLALLGR